MQFFIYIFCVAQDTDWLQDQMSFMCIDLREKYIKKSLSLEAGGSTAKTELGAKRACGVCGNFGHRSDNARCPGKVMGKVQDPIAAVLAGSERPAESETNVQPLIAPVFNASAVIDAFKETKAQFVARLKLSHLTFHAVPPSGECFWTASFKGLGWLCDRNEFYANSISRPADSNAMRQQVLDFILQNLEVDWAQRDNFLAAVSTFSTMIGDELPFGVCNGRTGLTDRAATIENWFSLMRYQYAYTSTVCLWATAICFRVTLKIFIMGSATEAYVPRKELEQGNDDLRTVHPDTTICLCKSDRGGHFDACRYSLPALFVLNPPTKKGRGRERQARLKSSIEKQTCITRRKK